MLRSSSGVPGKGGKPTAILSSPRAKRLAPGASARNQGGAWRHKSIKASLPRSAAGGEQVGKGLRGLQEEEEADLRGRGDSGESYLDS